VGTQLAEEDRTARPAYAEHVDALGAWWRRWQGSASYDAVTAVILTVVLTLGAYGEAHPNQPADQVVNGHPVPHTPLAAFLLVVLACLVLAVRHRYPVTVLIISTAAVVAYSALGYVNGAVLLAPAIALYTVAKTVKARHSLLLAAGTLVALMSATAAGNPFQPTAGGFYLIPALIAAPLFGGIAVRNRLAYVASIQARADDAANRRIGEERLRIARELHDVVAHTMATINVQATAASHVLAEQPAAAAEALQTIRLASKDGLRELRAILNVLRQADDADPTQPAPGLAHLDALIAGAGQAGLPTTLTTAGPARPLPPEVDLAAYRIIQESLTNTIRHAGPATATVSLGYGADDLRIEVTDTGRGAAPDPAGSTGHGLTGMRERAAAVGGTVQAGPGDGGGFRVVARLPATPWQPAEGQTAAVRERTEA
jgi:signal transduction histidine kinase